MSASTLPPGPTEPSFVQMMRWLIHPIAFLETCRRRFGDAFSVRLPGFECPIVMISDPEAIRALYTNPEHGTPPSRLTSPLSLFGPNSLLLLKGREHLSRRRLILQAFDNERMLAHEAIMRETIERDMERWPEEEPFAIHPRMQAITLEVMLRTVFGVTDVVRAQQLRERLPRLLSAMSSSGLQLRMIFIGRFGHGDPMKKLKELTMGVDELLYAEIAERRAESATAVGGDADRPGTARLDVLSLLIEARFDDGSAMTDCELRDHLFTLLLAGYETTAAGVAWTFDLLIRHPSAMQRLTAAVDAGEDAYLRAVVRETLRLRSVSIAGRRLGSELCAGELRLPAGTDVTPAVWLTHTRTELYSEPYAFRPERFLDRPSSGYGWIPFGGGVRRCIGASFAELEMRVALETVLRHRTLSPADPGTADTPRWSLFSADTKAAYSVVNVRKRGKALPGIVVTCRRRSPPAPTTQ